MLVSTLVQVALLRTPCNKLYAGTCPPVRMYLHVMGASSPRLLLFVRLCWSLAMLMIQVGSALSPEAQRQRGASGSYSYTTPAGNTAARQRLSFTNVTSSSSNTVGVAGPVSTSAGVQEVGAGHLALLPGSGSSLELVSAGRQALAMYAANESEAAALPPDWQRLYGDRDLRVSDV